VAPRAAGRDPSISTCGEQWFSPVSFARLSRSRRAGGGAVRPTRLIRKPAACDAPRRLKPPPRRSGGVELLQSSVILGVDHPLTHAIDAAQRIKRHCVVVGAVLVVAVINLGQGASWGAAVVVSATMVLFCYLIAAAALEARKRDRALDLIAEGRERVPLATVQRSRQRLRSARRQRRLARTIEGMIELALSPPDPCSRSARPLFKLRVVSSVAEELQAVCEPRRSASAAARGVALAEKLFGDGTSAFYGADPRPLRGQLQAIQRAMRE
jgi:hypothetical protein